jgi:hypothetical protein
MLLVAAASGFAAPEAGSDEVDQALQRVGEQFATLKEQDKLPGLGSKETGGEVSLFKIDPAGWKGFDLAPFKAAIAGCSNVYLADVEIGDKHLRYFFCDNGKARLTAAYRLKGETWTRI